MDLNWSAKASPFGTTNAVNKGNQILGCEILAQLINRIT